MSTWLPIVSNKGGVCRDCGNPYATGHHIMWEPESSITLHPKCYRTKVWRASKASKVTHISVEQYEREKKDETC
jgi:hypothetical protein